MIQTPIRSRCGRRDPTRGEQLLGQGNEPLHRPSPFSPVQAQIKLPRHPPNSSDDEVTKPFSLPTHSRTRARARTLLSSKNPPLSPYTRPDPPTMASHEEELMPENTSGYKISQPKQSLAAYQNMGKSRLFLSFPEASNGPAGLVRPSRSLVPARPPQPGHDVKRCKERESKCSAIASPEEVALQASTKSWLYFFQNHLSCSQELFPFPIPSPAHWSSCLAQLPTFLDISGCLYLLLRSSPSKAPPSQTTTTAVRDQHHHILFHQTSTAQFPATTLLSSILSVQLGHCVFGSFITLFPRCQQTTNSPHDAELYGRHGVSPRAVAHRCPSR